MTVTFSLVKTHLKYLYKNTVKYAILEVKFKSNVRQPPESPDYPHVNKR